MPQRIIGNKASFGCLLILIGTLFFLSFGFLPARDSVEGIRSEAEFPSWVDNLRKGDPCQALDHALKAVQISSENIRDVKYPWIMAAFYAQMIESNKSCLSQGSTPTPMELDDYRSEVARYNKMADEWTVNDLKKKTELAKLRSVNLQDECRIRSVLGSKSQSPNVCLDSTPTVNALRAQTPPTGSTGTVLTAPKLSPTNIAVGKPCERSDLPVKVVQLSGAMVSQSKASSARGVFYGPLTFNIDFDFTGNYIVCVASTQDGKGALLVDDHLDLRVTPDVGAPWYWVLDSYADNAAESCRVKIDRQPIPAPTPPVMAHDSNLQVFSCLPQDISIMFGAHRNSATITLVDLIPEVYGTIPIYLVIWKAG